MKALLIGGTGQISMAITKKLVKDGWEVYLLNRGNRSAELPEGVHSIVADINDEAAVLEKTKGIMFDSVCEFIGFVPAQAERDWRLFRGKTRQYIYISSASAYHKPVGDYMITEGTALANPYWEYSRNKIACEDFLMGKFREEGFPVTIVRPSHTYDERNLPLGVHGAKGPWQVLKRMMEGKPVIIQGDGTSLWTVTFNKDFAVGFTGLMGNTHAIGEAFQITSDETLTWRQIYEIIADVLGVEAKMYFVPSDFLDAVGKPTYDFEGELLGDKSWCVLFDNKKVKRAVPDFRCTTRFDQGVRRTIENILAHPELQVPDPEFDAWCDRVIAAMENAKKSLLQ